MKNTQIEWIGNIPDDWDVKPISTCFKERNEKVSDYDWKPLSVTKQGVVKQLETAAKSDAHDARKKVCKNDFVINSRSDRKQSCGVSPYDGSVSLINIVLENRKLNPKFVNYLLKNYGFAEEFYKYGSGIVADLWSTNYQKMKKIMIPIPPKEKQEKIADFFDGKVKEIDNVIAKTRETIEDYKKYKQSIITEAVTKGLNKNAKMKNSGIDWIEEYPYDWKLKKLKYSTKIRSEKYNKQYGNLEYFALENIESQSGKFMNTENKYGLESSMICKKNDIVFGKLRPYLAKVYKVEKDSCCSSEFAIFYDFEGKQKYLQYLMLSYGFIKIVDASTYGTKMPRANIDFLKNMIIPLPNKDEQIKISNYLNKRCIEIDKLISSKQKIIEELEQYKKSLIYEYVTGKKEVSVGKNTEIAELSLRIIEQLPNNYSMCKIKLNKIQSVILKMIKYKKEPDYEKYAAGPYSKEMMNNVYNVFKTEKWVKITKNGMRDVYTLDKNFKDGIKRYKEHFEENDDEIIRMIKLFEKKDTQESEIIATLFYCWNDFLIDGIQPTDEQIIEKFYNWSKRKKNIEIAKVKKNLVYMKKNNLIPNGYGKKTIQRSNNYGRK